MGGSKAPEPQVSNENRNTNETGRTTAKTKGNFLTQADTSVTAPSWVTNQWQGSTDAFGNIIDQFGVTPEQTQMGWDMARDVALGNDPNNAFATSLGYLEDEVSGRNLFGGQGFNEAVQAAGDFSAQNVLNRFIQSGRAGGGLAQAAMTKAYTDPFAAQYEQNRQRQQQAAQLLPGMSLMPASVLTGIGGQMDERLLQEAGLEAQLPGLLAPWLGSSTTSSTTGTSKTKGTTKAKTSGTTAGTIAPAYQPGSQFGSALGGGIAGAGVGATFGPIGAGIGGLIGAGSTFF